MAGQCPITFRFPCIRAESGQAGLTAEELATVLSPYIGGGVVSSVFGRTGDILAVTNDYAASEIENDSGVTGAQVSDALDTLEAAIPSVPVNSVFGRTGAVIAAASDYDASQVDNDSSVSGATVAAALNTLLTSGGAGKIAQVVIDTDASTYNLTAQIPNDDTIPQQSEGTELLSATITPINASSKLHVFSTINFTVNGAYLVTSALFRDAGADAIWASPTIPTNVNYWQSLVLNAPGINAGSTSSTTFKVRVGPSTGNLRINSDNTSRIYGGVMAASLIVMEILP